MEGFIQVEAREYIKKEIERKGLVCDYGKKGLYRWNRSY